jgi:aminopeptidase-like protein
MWGNDEMFWDGPGFEIPTVTLGRAPFDEYHTDADNMSRQDWPGLVKALWVLMRLVDVLERNATPKPKMRGPICLWRYGLYRDYQKDAAGYRAVQSAQILASGFHTILDIADETGADFFDLAGFFERAASAGAYTLGEV